MKLNLNLKSTSIPDIFYITKERSVELLEKAKETLLKFVAGAESLDIEKDISSDPDNMYTSNNKVFLWMELAKPCNTPEEFLLVITTCTEILTKAQIMEKKDPLTMLIEAVLRDKETT